MSPYVEKLWMRRAGPAACRGDADQVEQAAPCLLDDLRGQVGKRQSLNKCRNIREDPGHRRRIALVSGITRRTPAQSVPDRSRNTAVARARSSLDAPGW